MLVVGVIVVWRGGQGLRWRDLAPGLEFTMLHGEPFCRRGSSAIAVLRLDPERVRLRVRHYTQNAEPRPLDVVEWQRLTGSVAVFNAGQFYPDFRYLGLLASDGKWLFPRPHPGYQALLVARRHSDGRGARVLDMADREIEPDSLAWSEVAQSFMLFDRSGRIRVRQTDKVANRTAVGEDREGRLVVFTTEGGYTLEEFARLIQKSRLEIDHAMNLDGGNEAQLTVRAGSFRYTCMGGRTRGENGGEAAAHAPLPAVISVSTR